jgi:hypothetical protein
LGNQQPSPSSIDMEQVQRLNGSWDFKKSLRYSLLLCENKGINGAWFSRPLKQKKRFGLDKIYKQNTKIHQLLFYTNCIKMSILPFHHKLKRKTYAKV